jgi:predicted HAD superfamily hydrolase
MTLQSYDLVTFDIFDTLIHRRLRAPIDIFEAVRVAAMRDRRAILHHDIFAGFAHQRILAERLARERRIGRWGGEGEITFDEIYDQYQSITKCDDNLRHWLQSQELRLERSFLFQSAHGYRLFNELRAVTRTIALISDMYLPSSWLGETLEHLGFAGAAALPIFVSGELRKSKHNGTMYQEVRSRLGIVGTDCWLHVGDNVVADINQAEAHGVKTLLADWATVDNRRAKSKRPHTDYLVESIVSFLSTSQAGQVIPKDYYNSVGYRVFGPLIFGFMLWIMARTREVGVSRLAFIARDGWLPCSLFSLLKDDVGLGHIQHSYLHFSRQVAYRLGMKEWDVNFGWALFGGRATKTPDVALERAGYEPNQMLHVLERFGIERNEMMSPETQSSAQKMIATKFADGLLASQRRRQSFASYFDQQLEPQSKIGLVDIGWNGNIQRYLIGSLDTRFHKEQFTGLYLGLHSSAKPNKERGLVMHGWLSNYGDNADVETYLQNGGVELLEFALTADHGTTLDFSTSPDGLVEPVLEEIAPQEADYRLRAMKVQAGIRRFVDDYRFLLKIYDPAQLCTTAWARPFEDLVTNPQPPELAMLASLSHSDGVGATSMRAVLAEKQPDDVRLVPERLAKAREACFWKVAFDRLNDDQWLQSKV